MTARRSNQKNQKNQKNQENRRIRQNQENQKAVSFGAAFLRPDVQKTTYMSCYDEIMGPRKKMKKVRDQRDKSVFPRRTKTVKKSPQKELKP